MIDVLIEKIKEKQNPTVAGLDPKLDYIPEETVKKSFAEYGETFEGAADAIFEFNKELIDALCDIVPAVKPQSAYYEMYGIPGVTCLKRTIDYARDRGMYVILDAKRGDIGSTSEAYAVAYLGKTQIGEKRTAAFNADCLTVNPYLGTDCAQPFVKQCQNNGKAIFALVKTSNPSSGELQDLISGGKPIYEHVAALVKQWGIDNIGKYGYSQVGAVVGATYPQQAQQLRKQMPHTYFLVPGYGAQGGKAEDVAASFNGDGLGAIVNASRSIMCAYKKNGGSVGEAARAEAIRMRDDIVSVIK
ncbi:MAG TPA: orotidine-5'-phosphate decarboxylase [Candidatus Monoglobus merdigallinarum]|uniref:Orotidine 5'-phosphate decarboxylase n=1 Tax=Candidatus Monoglobus merdigallinarum TaxID=2838698 RepID=A0A9D1TLF7_9FIRM|nr:orotidine-5'-phosphate decarboxylase [Candidatus Monoglobus merdigallinarum]